MLVRQLTGKRFNRLLIATTTPGGKAGWAPATRPFFQPGKSFQEESLAPLADDLPRNVEPLGYLVVTESFGSIQRYLGPNDVAIR